MSSRIAARVAACLLAAVVAAGAVAGCVGRGSHRSAAVGVRTGTASGAAGVAPGAAARCPVTWPSAAGPPGASPDTFFGYDSSHGNGKLWVGGLWPNGVIDAGPEFVDPDGSVGMKFGWWRAVPGHLGIMGRRLDAAAPPLRADVPSGYGETGFQASGVTFPTEGCWEVTGKVGKTTLTFVTFVTKRKA
jgi:hypothetical protein